VLTGAFATKLGGKKFLHILYFNNTSSLQWPPFRLGMVCQMQTELQTLRNLRIDGRAAI